MNINLPPCPATPAKRQALELACREFPAVRDACLERCKLDPAWFTDYFVFTFDPRAEPSNRKRPFILYDFQHDLMQQLNESYLQAKDLLQEKSRDMGITWEDASFITDKWLFEEGYSCLIGSLREVEVDDRTIDSIFGKIDFILANLPGWMLPYGFTPKKHRKKLTLQHPTKPNFILGSASVPDFGRSGRYSMVYIDEGASFENLEPAWASCAATTNFRLITSTPKGQNYFWVIRESGIAVQTIHWSLHPERDEAWYQEECKRYPTPELIAQELDISYERSVSSSVYPIARELNTGTYPYQPGWPLWMSVDFGVNNPTAITVWQRDPATLRYCMVDGYTNKGKPIDFYVPFFTGEMTSEQDGWYAPQDLAWIAKRSLWGPALIYGDPAGNQRSQTDAKTPIDILAEHGVYVVTNASARDFETCKAQTEIGLRQTDVNVPACEPVLRALVNARFPEQKFDTRQTSEKRRPIHDWTADFRTSVEFFFVNVPSPTAISRPKPKQRRAAWQDLHLRKRHN